MQAGYEDRSQEISSLSKVAPLRFRMTVIASLVGTSAQASSHRSLAVGSALHRV